MVPPPLCPGTSPPGLPAAAQSLAAQPCPGRRQTETPWCPCGLPWCRKKGASTRQPGARQRVTARAASAVIQTAAEMRSWGDAGG
eukprot:3453367-Alexandrium_andersonii.AAC.1